MKFPLILYVHDIKLINAYKFKEMVQNASTPIRVRKGKMRRMSVCTYKKTQRSESTMRREESIIKSTSTQDELFKD